jgi:DNA primase
LKNSKSSYTAEQIKRVLQGSGVEIMNEVDSDYIIYCPFHNNSRTPAGEIDKNTGLFFCFSCHHVCDLNEFVMHFTGRSYFESARFIKSKESNSNIVMDINDKLEEKVEYSPFDELLIKRLNVQALDSPRAMSYFLGRRISENSVQKFSLGYSDKRDMVTIPIAAPDGMSVGFVGRSIEGKEFKNTPGLPKSKVLFNLHRVKYSKHVYLVESSFDVIRLDQVGMPAVATLGSSISSKQLELLRQYFSEIRLIADNDEAGNNMIVKLLEKLPGRVEVIKLEKKYKDIGDMDDDSIKNLEIGFDKSIAQMLQ